MLTIIILSLDNTVVFAILSHRSVQSAITFLINVFKPSTSMFQSNCGTRNKNINEPEQQSEHCTYLIQTFVRLGKTIKKNLR